MSNKPHAADARTQFFRAIEAEAGTPGWDLLQMAGRKRGYLVSGGEINTERMAKVLVDEYRSGKLGRFTLEVPANE